jgi:hypothetical protein
LKSPRRRCPGTLSALAKPVFRAVASYMVRKISTWRASPAEIAPIALNSAPNWPAVSEQLEYQPTSIRSASCSAGMPTSENPDPSARSPGQVAMPSMSLRLSPAFSIACSVASMVRPSADLSAPREIFDWPMPVMAVCFSG